MNRTSINELNVSMLVTFVFLAMMTTSIPALAGDDTMQTHLTDIADQMLRWSKQCSTETLTPEAQAKLGELLSETSQILKELAANSGAEMSMEHERKIQMMKNDWNPFDTSDRM
jgi:uncharacterized protein YlxW (UPF0749 family)